MKTFIAALVIAAISSVAYGQDDRFISVVDGHVTLNGAFSQLAGVEAKAPAGLNIGENPDFPGTGLPDVRPFGLATGNVVANEPTNAVLGVLGAGNVIDVEGVTTTGISYSGANSDLNVSLGIDGNPVPAAFPVVPEPATGLMAAFGLVGLLGLRRRR